MLLVIDVGNTNTVFAVFKQNIIVRSWRLSSQANRTADEYAFILEHFLYGEKIASSDIKAVVISNVVPQTEYAFMQLCKHYLHNITPIVVGKPDVKLNITINIPNPSEVGADRLVDAIAAYHLRKCAVIVVDFGTATTFNVINHEGQYTGGVIAPGVHLSLDALHRSTAKLPRVELTAPKHVVGKSTTEAIQSGMYWGYISMIEGVINRIQAQTNIHYDVIGTGGLVSVLAKGTDIFTTIEPDLTIYGLKLVYDLNH